MKNLKISIILIQLVIHELLIKLKDEEKHKLLNYVLNKVILKNELLLKLMDILMDLKQLKNYNGEINLIFQNECLINIGKNKVKEKILFKYILLLLLMIKYLVYNI